MSRLEERQWRAGCAKPTGMVRALVIPGVVLQNRTTFMTTTTDTLQRAYSIFVKCGNSLQPFLLLFVRLYWGWQFVVDGWGKLHNLPKVIEYFGSLGLPMPGPTAYFVSILELVGGVLLALGLGSRLIALLLTGNMTVASITGDREELL